MDWRSFRFETRYWPYSAYRWWSTHTSCTPCLWNYPSVLQRWGWYWLKPIRPPDEGDWAANRHIMVDLSMIWLHFTWIYFFMVNAGETNVCQWLHKENCPPASRMSLLLLLLCHFTQKCPFNWCLSMSGGTPTVFRSVLNEHVSLPRLNLTLIWGKLAVELIYDYQTQTGLSEETQTHSKFSQNVGSCANPQSDHTVQSAEQVKKSYESHMWRVNQHAQLTGVC